MADVTLTRGTFTKVATTTSTPTTGLTDGVHADTFVLPGGATRILVKVESSASNVTTALQMFAEHADTDGTTIHTVETLSSAAVAATNVALAEESSYFFNARWEVTVVAASRYRFAWGVPTNSGTVSIWLSVV